MAAESTHAGLAELAGLDRAGLVARWVEVFDCPAPRSAQAPLVRSALAWQLQMDASQWRGVVGGARLLRLLRVSVSAPVAELTPGTRLLREWRGQTHQVTVLKRIDSSELLPVLTCCLT